MIKQCHGFRPVFIGNFLHVLCNQPKCLIPAGRTKCLAAGLAFPYEWSGKAVFIIIHAHASGTPGAKPAVAMRVVLMPDDLHDLAILIGIGPSGTFPETHFAISGKSL